MQMQCQSRREDPFQAKARGGRRLSPPIALLVAMAAAMVSATGWAAESVPDHFGDPFLRATEGIADCPPQKRRTYTPDEMRAEAHSRAERGTRCYQSGRCRLPSSYDYDKEIVPRAKLAILADGRFAATSVWIEGQRRWVWLRGCVRTHAEARALERVVGEIEDVERVIDELVVKPR